MNLKTAARTALVGVAAFFVTGLIAAALAAATGGAGAVEIAMMTMLAGIIGVSASVVHHRRAASRATDAG